VVLIATCELAIDRVTWTTCAGSASSAFTRIWATALDYKIRNHTVPLKTTVISFFSQFDKIRYGVWRIFGKKLHMHIAFVGGNDCFHNLFLLQNYSYFRFNFVENSVDKALFCWVETDEPNVKFVMKQIPNRNV
jgi:hypothetical protein